MPNRYRVTFTVTDDHDTPFPDVAALTAYFDGWLHAQLHTLRADPLPLVPGSGFHIDPSVAVTVEPAPADDVDGEPTITYGQRQLQPLDVDRARFGLIPIDRPATSDLCDATLCPATATWLDVRPAPAAKLCEVHAAAAAAARGGR